MEFRILGPLEVREGQQIVELGAAKQRALLGPLLLHPNAFVSTSRLVGGVVGRAPAGDGGELVHGYVHALRKRLGAETVVTQGPRYTAALDGSSLDLLEFERLVEEARARRPPRPSSSVGVRSRSGAVRRSATSPSTAPRASYSRAPRRGPPDDAARGGRGRARARPPRRARRGARVARRRRPYQERAHGLLMIALYRSGRQTEALAAYQALRRRLDDELGLQPGQQLRELEAAILRQDQRARPPSETCGRGRGRARVTTVAHAAGRRRARAALAWAATVLVLAALVTWATAFRDGSSRVAVRAQLGCRDRPGSNRVVLVVPVGIRPGPVAAGDGSIWVANVEDRTVTWIAVGSARAQRNIALPATPTGIAFGEGAVWVAHGLRGQLSRVDPTFARVTNTVDATRTAVRYVDRERRGRLRCCLGGLRRFDARTRRRQHGSSHGSGVRRQPTPSVSRSAPGRSGSRMLASPRSSASTRRRSRKAPCAPPSQSETVRRASHSASEPCGLRTAATIQSLGSIRTRIRSGRYRSATSRRRSPSALARCGSRMQAMAPSRRIDPDTFDTETIGVGGAPAGIAVAHGRVWVSVREP